jgi:hypothetical protein
MNKPSGNEFQDMCTMIGLMTLTWAWAETTLGVTVGIINKLAGPIKGHPQAPLSLSKRVSCLKDALRDIPILKPLQQEGRALAMRFTELSKRRNDFVHGAAWQHNEGGFETMGLGVKAGDYAIQNHRFNQGDAVALNVEIAKLQDDAAVFVLKVANTLGQ